MQRILGLMAAMVFLSTAAMADTIDVLSAGAMARGLKGVAERYGAASGNEVSLSYATGSQIRAKVGGADFKCDLVIGPNDILAALASSGKLVASSMKPIAAGGAAIFVKDGTPKPDISTVAALKASLLAAKAVVYNTASSGLYVETMLKKLGVYEAIEGKIVKLADGDAVNERIVSGSGAEFGFGGTTDIMLHQDQGGVKLVGLLPDEVQNFTPYSAALPANATHPGPLGAKFLDYLASSEAKAILIASGLKPL